MKKLQKAVRLLEKIECYVIIVSVAVTLVLCCTQVTFRYLFNYPLGWPEELIRYLIILIVYVGASVAVREGSHIHVDILPTFFPATKTFLGYVSVLLGMVFSTIIIILGIKFVRSLIESGQIAITLEVPIYIVYAILPIGGVLLLFHYIFGIIEDLHNKKHQKENS
jgi:C4-dicarboxylate transporter DctQ subunit